MSGSKNNNNNSGIRDVDEETTALVKNYRIPRKDKEPKSILQEIAFDSREYQQDVYPILKQNYYQRVDSEKNFRYIHCYLVHNQHAAAQFEARKKEMKAKKMCVDGLQCGNRVFGSLGQPKLGVYISRYSDILTASPLISGLSGTFIMFKYIKGRSKLVPPQSAHLEPTPNYDCHIAKYNQADLQTASPLKLFEFSQIYLYEYNDTELATKVRHLFPLAVITYDYGSPLARTKDYVLWTGYLLCGVKCNIARMQLLANQGKMKPYSMGKYLHIKKLTSYSCAAQWQPIQELQSEQIQPVFYRRREVRLSNGMCASLFRLAQDRSEDFKFLVEKLMKNNAIGLSTLRGGTILLIFPASEFSDQLGIPRYCDTFSNLHCLVVSYRSCVTGIGFTKDPYDVPSIASNVPASFRLNLSKLQASKLPVLTQKPPAVHSTAAVHNQSPPALIADEDLRPLNLAQRQQSVLPEDPFKMLSQISDNRQQGFLAPPAAQTVNTASVLDPRLSKMLSMFAGVSSSATPDASCVSSPNQTSNADHSEAINKTTAPPVEDAQNTKTIEAGTDDAQEDYAVENSSSPASVVNDDAEACYSGYVDKLDEDMEFITLEDTPSSPPGPQEPNVRKEYYKPPVIVPLENVRPAVSIDSMAAPSSGGNISFPSTSAISPSPARKDNFVWNQLSQKMMDDISDRSKSILLSQIERAIISGGVLRKAKQKSKRKHSSSITAVGEAGESTLIRSTSTPDEVDRLVIDEISEASASSKFVSKTNMGENEADTHKSVDLDEAIFIESSIDAEKDTPKIPVKGLLIPDDLIFLKTSAQDAELILNHFYQMHRLGTADWCMKVHSQMVLKLADSKKNLDPQSGAHDRVTKLLILLTRYRNLGRVELLSRHECDVSSKASKDYLTCLRKIRQDNPDHCCIFLSNLNPNSQPAKEFADAGITVRNVQSFIENFITVKSD